MLRRALYKLFVGRLRYGRGDDYDARRYWSDRFWRYGLSPKGSGHPGGFERRVVVLAFVDGHAAYTPIQFKVPNTAQYRRDK